MAAVKPLKEKTKKSKKQGDFFSIFKFNACLDIKAYISISIFTFNICLISLYLIWLD